jgi:ABC-type Zn uptake system ZnuABC Zn-binding protein ZnuA
MNKIILLCLSISCFFFNLHAQKKLRVVASASIFADMASNIGGSYIETISIVPIGGDPHKYEATPDDAKLIASADLILINGLTFEGWINEVINNSGTKAKTILITKGIKPIQSDSHQNAVDPHAWMDPQNGLIYIENIYNALVQANPQHAAIFEKNKAEYAAQINALHLRIQTQISAIPEEKRVLITTHDAFSYFCNRYNMKVRTLMGISTEADAQTTDLKKIIEAIEVYKVPAIFIESTINPKLLYQIAKDYKVKIGGSLYADSIGEKGSSGESYVKMLQHNATVIAEALIDSTKHIDMHSSDSLNRTLYILLAFAMALSWIILYVNIKK